MALRDLFRRRREEEAPQESPMEGMRQMLQQSEGAGSMRPGYQEFRRRYIDEAPDESATGESAAMTGSELEAASLGARMGAESMISGNMGMNRPMLNVVTKEMLMKAQTDLMMYRSGKASVERRVIAAQQWWKLRNAEMQAIERGIKGPQEIQSATLWLWSAIVAAHADLMNNYPEPLFLPREQSDEEEAQKLTKVVPVILKNNKFKRTYSKLLWQFATEGTLVSGTFWDKTLENGLGDVSIKKVNILNLFWEPGINELEESKQIFYTYLMDNDELLAEYPQLEGKVGQNAYTNAEYQYDDNTMKDNKSMVVDWYYKKRVNGKTVVHLCTYCNDEILYSTENSGLTEGLYDDGKYPFDMLAMFPIEGSPAGYGMIDIGKDCQMDIDAMNRAMVLNGIISALPRKFVKNDGNVNEQEYADLTKMLVHVTGSIDENAIRNIETPQMPAHVMNVYDHKIDELKTATGNTDVNNGSVPAGVTAASAIAALQEENGKGRKDITQNLYDWYETGVCEKTVSRVRVGYTIKRTFRITGEGGKPNSYVQFDNSGLRPQPMQEGMGLGGDRLPVFDIEIKVQRENAYTRLSNNELVLQMNDKGFFLPQNANTALMALGLMDFDGREKMMTAIREQGTLMDAFMKVSQIALALAQRFDPAIADQLAMITQGVAGGSMQMQLPAGGGQNKLPEAESMENPQAEAQRNPLVNRARERTQNATQV